MAGTAALLLRQGWEGPGGLEWGCPSFVFSLDESSRDTTHSLSRYQLSLESLLVALRQNDPVRLYFCLLDLTRGATELDNDFCHAVKAIPGTTFSEILRIFDPVNVQKNVDSAPEICISYGASVQTPLGELVNKWGVKTLYVSIFNRLRLIQQARRSSQVRPLLNDYAVLLRCAGATSNIQAAKEIWFEVKRDGYQHWIDTQLYTEFIKVRYLTEALYANNNLARLRLRPLDLYRTSIWLPKATVKRLKALVSNTTSRQAHRFGQNQGELYWAEPLTRMLRRRFPLAKLERSAFRRGFLPADELLACAVLKANGRNGRTVASRVLLKDCWGINVVIDWDAGTVDVSGGADFPPGSAKAPTEALLDAVVHCFGNQGQVVVAVKLVDFLSTRYGLMVPDKVWSDLLDYARIQQTRPASTEWRLAGFPSRLIKTDTLLDIWNVCTQHPYNFKPGMKDYYTLTKILILETASKSRPLEAIRQIRPLYRDTVRQLREAWQELVLTTRQGVPNYAAYRRYRVLQSRKNYMWYCFHYTALQLLKKTKPGRVDDHNAVRIIPEVVRELGPFMPKTITYRIATGIVQLQNDHVSVQSVVTTQAVAEPRPISERPLPEVQGSDSAASQEGNEINQEEDPASEDEIEDQDDDMCGHATKDFVGAVASGESVVSAGDSPPSSTGVANFRFPPDWPLATQVIERPAFMYRPPLMAPPGQVSLTWLRDENKIFTGFHDDQRKKHYAAHRVLRTTVRAAAVPVDLGAEATQKTQVRHLVWMQR
ncbi:hypothetical protein M406DRAFT_70286 [Cryphonectria parasitica EP155]|uniref:Uncharacterized protein n=1 Tax=Cryphonectria parasitica (strain ATCC 38755 / EP155) TaxID=660469 RepID=A0A9P4Y1F1_CRYP1|nr:uncharacterized protein M406DRAFT_70286 [Cryphonectria parasitica EP155]KAF3765219.1 hypothetical protein M406DRAFT_70286 [Cryphonectria parasitica EP155]